MNTPNVQEGRSSDDFAFLWNSRLTPREIGGLGAARGFYYQSLYSLRLMEDILEGRYNGYSAEFLEDFFAWSDDFNKGLKRLLLVQVKTSLRGCILSNRKSVHKVFDGFCKSVAKLDGQASIAEIRLRLVVNSHQKCDHDSTGKDQVRCQRWFEPFKRKISALLPSALVVLEIEHFLPIPVAREQLLDVIAFRCRPCRRLQTQNTLPLQAPIRVPRQSLRCEQIAARFSA